VLKRFVDLKILNLFSNSDLELDQFYLVISRKTQKHFGLFSEKHNTVLTFKTILKDPSALTIETNILKNISKV
jgi:hypothetical protein